MATTVVKKPVKPAPKPAPKAVAKPAPAAVKRAVAPAKKPEVDEEDVVEEGTEEVADDATEETTEEEVADDAEEAAEEEVADDEFVVDDESEPAEDTAEEPEPPKAKAAKKPAPAPAAEEDEVGSAEFEVSEPHTAAMLDVDSIKIGKLRRPIDDEHVEMLMKAIRLQGLRMPISVGKDMVIIAGHHRLEAFKRLKKKQIPAFFATDKDGNQITSTEAAAQLQAGMENLSRKQMTPMQTSNYLHGLIKSKIADGPAALSQQLGIPAGTVSRYLSLTTDASKKVIEALEKNQISMGAASTLIARVKDPAKQDELIDQLGLVAQGKIGKSAVTKATAPTKTRTSKATGVKPARTTLGGEALQTEETGITGFLRRDGRSRKDFTIGLSLDIQADDMESFARYDLTKAVLLKLQSLDTKAVRAELEAARERLLDG